MSELRESHYYIAKKSSSPQVMLSSSSGISSMELRVLEHPLSLRNAIKELLMPELSYTN